MTWIKQLIRFALSEASVLVAVAAVSGLLLVAILAADAGGGERNFDLYLLKALHPGENPANPAGPDWLDHAILDLTSLGSIAVLTTVALSAAGFLLLRGQAIRALELSVALAGGIVISETLKSVFERSRPPEAYRAVEVINESFPSGHALLSTVVYLALGAMLTGATSRKPLKRYIMGVAIFLALLVGFSRVYLGAHWASDVLAGWCVGASWALVCWLAGQAIEQRRHGRVANDG